MAKSKQLPLVCIKWIDAFTSDTSWTHLNLIREGIKQGNKDALSYTCFTVGFLLDETEDYVRVAQTVDLKSLRNTSDIDGDASVNCIMNIPKGMILEKKVFPLDFTKG